MMLPQMLPFKDFNRIMKPAVFFLFLLAFSSPAFAQNITLEIEGSCKGYNVTLTAYDLKEGCYDAKVDVTTPEGRVGQIYDPREGWKSSIYYVNEAFCAEENGTVSEMFRILMETGASRIYFEPRLRSGSAVVEGSYMGFDQHCPYATPDYFLVFSVAVAIMLILVFVILIYMRF